MKIFIQYIVLLVFFFFANNTHLFAQKDILDKKITVNANNVSLVNLLDEISSKYKIDFTYSNDLINDDFLVTIKLKNKPFKSFIEILQHDYGIDYLIIENQLVLKPAALTKQDEKYTISGYLRDKSNGENMYGATIYIKEQETGTITNPYGYYSITLPAGTYTIIYHFIGYKDIVKVVDLKSDMTIDEFFEPSGFSLKEIEIKSSDNDEQIENNQMSEVNLSPKTLQNIPSCMGENEVIKSLNLVPGISNYGDGSTYYYVRGGARDQNLIMIDDAPVFNPSHVLGFFSAFIPNAIQSVKVYKGDFPVEYGDRLSSIMDIRTKEGNMFEYDGSGSIGPFISRISVDGPIFKEKSSFFISLRKSNLNWINHYEGEDISFTDINFKFNFKIGQKNRIYYSGYLGSDFFNMLNYTSSLMNGVRWSNFTNTLRWNHVFNKKLFSNTTIYTSSYDYNLILEEDLAQDISYYWNSNISTASLKTDFTYYLNPKNTIKFGYQYAFYGVIPGTLIFKDFNMSQIGYPVEYNKYADETSIYFGNDYKYNKRLSLKYGFRMSLWTNLGPGTEYVINTTHYPVDTLEYKQGERYNKFRNLEPRLSVQYKLNDISSFKVSYSRTVQYLQILTNSISPFTSIEIWYPSGPNILPQKSNQYILGYYRFLKKYNLNIATELYYKSMINQIDYKDHASVLLNPLIETQLRFGKTWSYGIELFADKNIGNFNFMMAYTYSRVWRLTNEVNNGLKYPAFQDRPHDFSLSASYKISKYFTSSISWVYATGSAISTPTGFLYYHNQPVPIYGEKNNSRLPDYHRLDLMLKIFLNPNSKKDFKHEILISVYNAYLRKNYYTINFNKIDDNGKITIPSDYLQEYDFVPTSRYLLGIIPSVTYNFKF